MNKIYREIGVSKQSFHQWLNRTMVRYEEQEQLLPIIREIRKDHPMLSSRQIYKKVQPKTMGRDSFEAFCFKNGFKVEIKKSKHKTTDGRGYLYFPNLLLTMNELTYINQLWVSDITYFDVWGNTYYLTFITDLFNREIVGYSASLTLRTEDTILPAFKMALCNRNLKKVFDLIFHSDGGGQYYCKEFVSLTKKYGIKNSMGKTPYENPHAERVNGIIKNEYLIPYKPTNFKELEKIVNKSCIFV
jgi:transposase InsO family protein